MSEKSPTPSTHFESSAERESNVPTSAHEFVQGIKEQRQLLQDQLAQAESRDTSHNLQEVGTTYELQRKRDVHAIEGKLLDLEQGWMDVGGAEIDSLQAELQNASEGRSDIKRRILRAQEAAYQNYLEENGLTPEVDEGGEEKDPVSPIERTLGDKASLAAGVKKPGTELVLVSKTDETSPADNDAVATGAEGAPSGPHDSEETGRRMSAESPAAPSREVSPDDRVTADAEPVSNEAGKDTAPGTLSDKDKEWIREVESSKDMTAKERVLGIAAIRRRLESEGVSSEDVAKMLDTARNDARGVDAEKSPVTPDSVASTEAAGTDLPTAEDLATHEEVERQLQEAGELKQPSSRKLRRTIRRLRRNKARVESYSLNLKTEGERMKREKELFAKYRKDYFNAKGVKNTLLNRMRYRYGRDVK